MDHEQIDRIIDRFDARPGALIMILMETQHHHRWLPKEALERISERLGVPLAKVQQIAAFYKTFSLVPRGDHEVHVCTGTSCHLRGAQKVLDAVYEVAGIRPGETDADAKFSLTAVNCMGTCALGPVMQVDGTHHGRLAPRRAADVLKNIE